MHDLLCSSFPSPGAALDDESGPEDYVELLIAIDQIEGDLAASMSWGRELHWPALVSARERAVVCQLRWRDLLVPAQEQALDQTARLLNDLVAPNRDLSTRWTKLDGFSAIATAGTHAGCVVSIVVPGPGIVLFSIEGSPRGRSESVSWEASATDDLGVQEWLSSFGLATAAGELLDRELND